ncbi:hypothetical protein KFK09_015856 [Dendrobium nobile]|uniref:Uncharacterized protein n=1 Tax=Dendrobium nobile TaxID=94219 RepID=A0A8T3B783_DENNO|nr:hypothetical protein KFK09_015856 [Dendrobium nobile]
MHKPWSLSMQLHKLGDQVRRKAKSVSSKHVACLSEGRKHKEWQKGSQRLNFGVSRDGWFLHHIGVREAMAGNSDHRADNGEHSWDIQLEQLQRPSLIRRIHHTTRLPL